MSQAGSVSEQQQRDADCETNKFENQEAPVSLETLVRGARFSPKKTLVIIFGNSDSVYAGKTGALRLIF